MTKTILVLAANPKDTPPLRLAEEIREIDNGLERAKKRDEFILKQKLAARSVDVRRAVLDHKPNIVHFCGHGSGEEGIAFEDENGQAKLVSADALAGFFELFADKVECVVLNACYSEVQAEAIAKHIPYVVGMRKAIGDSAAIEFAVAFYDALGAGKPIEFAYKLACNAIQWKGLPEHLTPTLKTHSIEKHQLQTRELEGRGKQRKIVKIVSIGIFLFLIGLLIISQAKNLPQIIGEPTLASGSEDGTTRPWTLSAGGAESTQATTASTVGSGPAPRSTSITLSSRAITVDNAAQVMKQSNLDVSESRNIVWSLDGKWLIIGERKIHFYNAQSLKEVHAIQADRWVVGLAISPDSKILAAIDESRGVMLFDVSGSELRTLPRTHISTSAASNSFLAFSPDSATVAVIIGDVVKLFNVASGQETSTIVAKDAINIAISPDGKNLYAAGWGENITVWDIASGSKIGDFGDLSRGVNRMILSPDGSMLASAGTFDGAITLWEAATGHQLRMFTGHTQAVSCLAFSPDGKVLASAAEDVTIKLWNTATGDLLNTLVGHSQPATSIAISPDGATLASSSYMDGVLLWSLPVQ